MVPERRQHIIELLRKHVKDMAALRHAQTKKAAAMAALCIEDAFAGRLSNGLATNHKKSATMFWIFRIQTSQYLLNLILIASVVHSMCVFYEPLGLLSSAQWQCIHLLVTAIYALDVGLKMTYQGFEVLYCPHCNKQSRNACLSTF